MPPLTSKLIPGYAEAISRESQNRERAFLGVPDVICGLEVQPLSVRRVQILDALSSPFLRFKAEKMTPEVIAELINEGAVSAADVAIFLWTISPRHRVLNTWRDRWVYNSFLRNLRGNINSAKACSEIFVFISDTFQDGPNEGGKPSPSYVSLAASVVDWLASEYGWSEETVINMPLKRVFQYIRAIQIRKYGTGVLFNSSDKMRGDFLRVRNKITSN